MAGFEDALDTLVSELKDTEEYQSWVKAKRRVGRNSELSVRLKEYRLRRFYLQSRPARESDTEDIHELDKEFGELLCMSAVREYLLSEQRICKKVRSVWDRLEKTVKLDLED